MALEARMTATCVCVCVWISGQLLRDDVFVSSTSRPVRFRCSTIKSLCSDSFPLSGPGSRFLSKIELSRFGHRVDGHGVTETFERLVSECTHFERLPLKRPRELFVRYDAPRGCDLHEARGKVDRRTEVIAVTGNDIAVRQ